MGLFDIFGTQDQQNAAAAQIAGIRGGLGQYGQQAEAGRGALVQGVTGAANDLTANYGAGQNALTTNYGAALAPWTSVFQGAQPGVNMYANAVGLGGAAGGAQALDAFKTANPAYGFGLQQGTNAALADAANKGYLGSGNTAMALQNWGQDYANQQYGNWVNRLSPYLQQQLAGAGGIAGVGMGLGGALNANNMALGSQLAGNQMNLGTQLLGSYTGQGQAGMQGQAAIGAAQANALLANLQASQNEWNAIGGGLNLFSKLAGFGGGGGFSGGSPGGGALGGSPNWNPVSWVMGGSGGPNAITG